MIEGDELPIMDDLDDEAFLRAIRYDTFKTFRDDPSMKRVVSRLASITLDLYYRSHPEVLGS